MTAHRVEVELLILRALHGDGPVGYRLLRAPLGGGQTPDAVALALAGPVRMAGAVCHSTSWRHDGVGLVVTYAALPDPCPELAAAPLRNPGVLSSGDPLRPGPRLLHDHHVVAHAVRHLAHLAATDPVIAAVARTPEQASLWAAIVEAAAATPTGTHDRLAPHDHRARPRRPVAAASGPWEDVPAASS